jgi:type VI secretion system protein ImpK
MTKSFSKAVDPIFEYVLSLLDRIEQGDEPDAQQTQTFLYNVLLTRAEQELGHTAEWQLAKRAIIFWIDEMLTRAFWKGRSWWVNNLLAFQLLQTAEGSLEFYLDAKKAVGGSTLNALEVFYICVILGFRGIYERPEENSISIATNDLPPTIEDWLQRMGEGIRLSPLPPLITTGRLPVGAPPRGGYLFLSSALIVLVMSAAAFVGTIIWQYGKTQKDTKPPKKRKSVSVILETRPRGLPQCSAHWSATGTAFSTRSQGPPWERIIRSSASATRYLQQNTVDRPLVRSSRT